MYVESLPVEDKDKDNDCFDSLVQDCSNSIANALELLQSCTKPSICHITSIPCMLMALRLQGTASSSTDLVLPENPGLSTRMAYNDYEMHFPLKCEFHTNARKTIYSVLNGNIFNFEIYLMTINSGLS